MDGIQKLELEIEDALRDHERYKGYVSVQRYRSNMRSIQAKRSELHRLREAVIIPDMPEVPLQIEVEVKRVPFSDYLQNVVCYRCNRRGHYAPSCRVKEEEALLQERGKLEVALQNSRETSIKREQEVNADRKKVMENYHRYFLSYNDLQEASRKRRRLERVLKNLS